MTGWIGQSSNSAIQRYYYY